jgi:hypothetical protein
MLVERSLWSWMRFMPAEIKPDGLHVKQIRFEVYLGLIDASSI